MKMKRRKRIITDLNFDVLRNIIKCVAKSSDGAGKLVVLSSVCRLFKEIAGEKEVLKVVKFNGENLFDLHESFWKQNGLLSQCMQNGNQSALQFAIQYADTLDATYKVHRRGLFRGMLVVLARVRAVDTANTRLRRKKLQLAEDEFKKGCDDADVDIKKGKEFLEMLRSVIK